MICITGAGGTVGSELVRYLQQGSHRFRLAYHAREKADAARAKGFEAVLIDYRSPDTLHAAFKNCEKIFLLGPNSIDQTALELNAVQAAKAAGVQHVVKQSVMGAEEESYSLAKVHRPVEQAIESSGLDWTFLRPNSFMQNIVTFMAESIRTENSFYSASGKAKISHVDVRDIAAVAAHVLTETGHQKKAYTLTGPDPLSYEAIAGELSVVLGRTISHVSLAPAEYLQGMIAEGMPEQIAERMLDLERYFREGRAAKLQGDIKLVTGAFPHSFQEYLREVAAAGILEAVEDNS